MKYSMLGMMTALSWSLYAAESNSQDRLEDARAKYVAAQKMFELVAPASAQIIGLVLSASSPEQIKDISDLKLNDTKVIYFQNLINLNKAYGNEYAATTAHDPSLKNANLMRLELQCIYFQSFLSVHHYFTKVLKHELVPGGQCESVVDLVIQQYQDLYPSFFQDSSVLDDFYLHRRYFAKVMSSLETARKCQEQLDANCKRLRAECQSLQGKFYEPCIPCKDVECDLCKSSTKWSQEYVLNYSNFLFVSNWIETYECMQKYIVKINPDAPAWSLCSIQ